MTKYKMMVAKLVDNYRRITPNRHHGSTPPYQRGQTVTVGPARRSSRNVIFFTFRVDARKNNRGSRWRFKRLALGLIQSTGSTQESGKRTTVREMCSWFFLSFDPLGEGWVIPVDVGKRGASENSRRQHFDGMVGWWGSLRRNLKYVSWRGTERGTSGNCCFCAYITRNMVRRCFIFGVVALVHRLGAL
jgi:hypothetical protein